MDATETAASRGAKAPGSSEGKGHCRSLNGKRGQLKALKSPQTSRADPGKDLEGIGEIKVFDPCCDSSHGGPRTCTLCLSCLLPTSLGSFPSASTHSGGPWPRCLSPNLPFGSWAGCVCCVENSLCLNTNWLKRDLSNFPAHPSAPCSPCI